MTRTVQSALRRVFRPVRFILTQTRDEVIATVPCPNRKCAAGVGEPCPRGVGLHRRRIQAWQRAERTKAK